MLRLPAPRYYATYAIADADVFHATLRHATLLIAGYRRRRLRRHIVVDIIPSG